MSQNKTEWDADKEDAYQRWKKAGLESDEFEPLNDGPLIRDSRTQLVWDVIEFEERELGESSMVDGKNCIVDLDYDEMKI